MNIKAIKGCRLTCEKFERILLPSFHNFSFYKAFKIAEKILESQDEEHVIHHLVREFNSKQMMSKQPIRVKQYIAEHLRAASVEHTVKKLISISRNPSQYKTPCCDAGIDVFIHKNMVYAVPLSDFINEYKFPKSLEDFSYSEDIACVDSELRRETWQKLYKMGRMRMEIINVSKNVGVEEIRNHFLKLPTTKETLIEKKASQDIQAA